MQNSAIVWFRRDLRLADNPALRAAVDANHDVIVPVFIHAPGEFGEWAPGAAQCVWLHHSLQALAGELESLGSRLVIRNGPTLEALETLIEASEASAVYWNRLYDPPTIARDKTIKSSLGSRGDLLVKSCPGHLLFEPWQVETRQGTPYKVFTPFWKRIGNVPSRAPLAKPTVLPKVPDRIASLAVSELGLLPDIRWDHGIFDRWQPGEEAAQDRLERFLETTAPSYGDDRNQPAISGTSHLSPYLHWGEISPRQVMDSTQAWLHEHDHPGLRKHIEQFQSEMGWREFAHHVLYHFPGTPDEPLDKRFQGFPWRRNEAALRLWQSGQTGIPMVDAGMRELWATGYMHNRVRMTVASFLTKNLLISWHTGACWFWDTLVDADLANNTLGWQWAAGCGADAAPYFRIFNPVRQGQRFDPDGAYVKRWIPELKNVPRRYLHEPWRAPASKLRQAGVTLGENYPQPMVDLKASREKALEVFSGHLKSHS